MSQLPLYMVVMSCSDHWINATIIQSFSNQANSKAFIRLFFITISTPCSSFQIFEYSVVYATKTSPKNITHEGKKEVDI